MHGEATQDIPRLLPPYAGSAFSLSPSIGARVFHFPDRLLANLSCSVYRASRRAEPT
jgi:hypothetical protein